MANIHMVASENFRLELSIDWRDGSINLIEYHESNNATDMEVYYGYVTEYSLPDAVTERDWTKLNEDLAPLVSRAVAGFDIRWDGNNMVGTFDEDGQAAYDAIAELIDDFPWDEISVWNAYEWVSPILIGYDADGEAHSREPIRYEFSDDGAITWETTDAELEALAETLESGGEEFQVVRDMHSYLSGLRDECQRNYAEVEREIIAMIEDEPTDTSLRRFIDHNPQFRPAAVNNFLESPRPARESAKVFEAAFASPPQLILPPAHLYCYPELEAAMLRAFNSGHPKLRRSNRSGDIIFTECCWPRWMGDYWIGVSDLHLDRHNINAARWQLDHAGIKY